MVRWCFNLGVFFFTRRNKVIKTTSFGLTKDEWESTVLGQISHQDLFSLFEEKTIRAFLLATFFSSSPSTSKDKSLLLLLPPPPPLEEV